MLDYATNKSTIEIYPGYTEDLSIKVNRFSNDV